MTSVCIDVIPTCSFARVSPATNSEVDVDGPAMPSITCVPSFFGSNAPVGAAVDLSCPPDNVRSHDARTASEPYTIDPSKNEVIVLICWAGLAGLVPVVGSIAERPTGMTCVPLFVGSNDGSPSGTGMLNEIGGAADFRKSMS